jgi:hypothetical protein
MGKDLTPEGVRLRLLPYGHTSACAVHDHRLSRRSEAAGGETIEHMNLDSPMPPRCAGR